MAADARSEDSVGHVTELLDFAVVRIPEDDPEYPFWLHLVFFELFSYLRHAAAKRHEGKDRAAAIDSLRAVYTFLARFESGIDGDLLASFLSLESALLALDTGVVEPLLRPTRTRGRGWNTIDREFAIGAVVIAVRQLKWVGLGLEQAYAAVARAAQKAGLRAERGSRPVKP